MALVPKLEIAAAKQSGGVSAFTLPRCVVAFCAGCCSDPADKGNWNDTEFESDVCHSASRSCHQAKVHPRNEMRQSEGKVAPLQKEFLSSLIEQDVDLLVCLLELVHSCLQIFNLSISGLADLLCKFARSFA